MDVALMVTEWEHAMAEVDGFAAPDERAVLVSSLVGKVVGWEAVCDAISEALDEHCDRAEAMEVGLRASGYIATRARLFPRYLPPPAST